MVLFDYKQTNLYNKEMDTDKINGKLPLLSECRNLSLYSHQLP